MKISVYETAEDTITGRPELWVIVQSNEIFDLPRALRHMDETHPLVWGDYDRTRPIFNPHFVTAEERAEHGYRYEDRWIFEKVSN